MKKFLVTPQRPKNEHLAYQFVDGMLRRGLRLLPDWAWTERIALSWGYRFRPAPCVAQLRSGALMQVDPTDHVQLLIYYLGTFEQYCLRYLRKCTDKGRTIVDVGANIGIYTLESSLMVGPTGRVISIEAAPPHIYALQNNIQLNRMKNISLIESAVGDSIGRGKLTLPTSGNQGMFTLGSVAGDQTYEVAVRPLDDILEECGANTIDVIKIDIEGSEYGALRGAGRTLLKHRPTLLIELNDSALLRCRSSTREVKRLLRECGYRGWVLGRRAVRPIPEIQLAHGCDECLFVHRDNEALIHKLRLS